MIRRADRWLDRYANWVDRIAGSPFAWAFFGLWLLLLAAELRGHAGIRSVAEGGIVLLVGSLFLANGVGILWVMPRIAASKSRRRGFGESALLVALWLTGSTFAVGGFLAVRHALGRLRELLVGAV
jgi:hypothetical protein